MARECINIDIPGIGRVMACRRGVRGCYLHRSRPSKFQCDFPSGPAYKSGKRKGQKRSCDRHLCDECVKHGITPGIDFCREHFPIAKAAYERRMKEKNDIQTT